MAHKTSAALACTSGESWQIYNKISRRKNYQQRNSMNTQFLQEAPPIYALLQLYELLKLTHMMLYLKIYNNTNNDRY